MGTGYTRNDTSNNIADGNIINAADLDGEFDAIESAMGTSGHTHDGTSAEGGPITVLGPVQDFVASATEIKPKTTNILDIGTDTLLFKDMFLDGVATMGSIKIDNAGTIGSASEGDAIAISSGGVVTFSQAPVVDVTNATTNAVTDVLDIQVQSTGTPAVGIGSGFTFGVETAAGNVETGGAIRSITTGLTPTAEEIDLVFYSMRNGSLTEAFRFDSNTDSLRVEDSVKVTFGDSQDLQIYHTGTNSVIDNNTGHIYIRNNVDNDDGSNIYIQGKSGENSIVINDDSNVELYFDNAIKLATTSTGVDITGVLSSDGLTVDGDVSLSEASPTISFTDTTDSSSHLVQSINSTFNIQGQSAVRLSTAATKRFDIDNGGDIRFYEDTGTTAKFFWDASAESLGIGVSTSSNAVGDLVVGTSTGGTITLTKESGSYAQNDLIGRIDWFNEDNSGEGENVAAYIGAYASGSLGDNAYLTFNTVAAATGGADAGEAMRIDSSGNVGIGTDSPATALDVLSGSASVGALKVTNASGASASTPILEAVNGGGNTRLIVLNDGSVGIGTDSPSALLQVEATDGTAGGAIKYTSSGVASGYMSADAAGLCLATDTAGITFRTGITSNDPTDTGTEAMRIDSSGNVGIGTSSPSELLEVHSTGSSAAIEVSAGQASTTTGEAKIVLRSLHSSSGTSYSRSEIASLGVAGGDSDLIFRTTTTSSGPVERMRIDSEGLVGIGTDSPSADLDVASSNATIHLTDTDDTTYAEIRNNGGTFTIASDEGAAATNSSINFRVDGSEAMRIDSSGNLLVGTTGATLPESGTTSAHVGVSLDASNYVASARYQNIAGYFNRIGNDGDIVQFRKDGATVGSIGTANTSFGTNPYIAGSGGRGLSFDVDVNRIFPCSSTGARADGSADLGASTARFKDLYLSGGVVFGDAGGSGTSTSNTLDSYEEGTWTPSITGSTTNPTGLNYTNQIGQYTKVGRQVTVHFRIQTTGGSGGSGTFNISGLPFTPSSERSSAIISFSRRITNGGGPLAVHSYVGSSGFNLYKYTDADDFDTAIEISDVTSFASLVLHGSLTYYAT